jgi:hypothetical protein
MPAWPRGFEKAPGPRCERRQGLAQMSVPESRRPTASYRRLEDAPEDGSSSPAEGRRAAPGPAIVADRRRTWRAPDRSLRAPAVGDYTAPRMPRPPPSTSGVARCSGRGCQRPGRLTRRSTTRASPTLPQRWPVRVWQSGDSTAPMSLHERRPPTLHGRETAKKPGRMRAVAAGPGHQVGGIAHERAAVMTAGSLSLSTRPHLEHQASGGRPAVVDGRSSPPWAQTTLVRAMQAMRAGGPRGGAVARASRQARAVRTDESGHAAARVERSRWPAGPT